MKLKQMISMKIFIEINMFDFSDYPQDSKFFDSINKKVIEKMRDELKRKIISEFVKVKKVFFRCK